MKRRWPLRLLEFSPLIVLGIALAFWFAVPASVRTVALQARSSGQFPAAFLEAGFNPPDLTAMVLEQIERDQREAGGAPGQSYDMSQGAREQLAAMSDVVTSKLMSSPGRFVNPSGEFKPFAVPESDPGFDALRVWERNTGGRAAVFVLPPVPNPPIALQSIVDTGVLTAEELREFETSGTLEALRREARGGDTALLPVDASGMGNGTGDESSGRRRVFHGSLMVGGRAYETYGVYPARTNAAGVDDGLWGDAIQLTDFKVLGSEGNQRAVDRAVQRFGGAAFIVGPTDAPLVPVRLPKGVTEQQARAAVNEQLGARNQYGAWPSDVRAASSYVSSKIGGAKWFAAAVQDPPGAPIYRVEGGGVAQPMVFAALYDSNPEVPLIWARLGEGKTLRKQAQVWLSVNALIVAGILAVLFLAALIASPLAFLYERQLNEEADFERERERVRRQARERVVDRLTGLSERMDAAASTASVGTQREIAGVAHDIDTTVEELRAILGDLGKRGGDRDE